MTHFGKQKCPARTDCDAQWPCYISLCKAIMNDVNNAMEYCWGRNYETRGGSGALMTGILALAPEDWCRGQWSLFTVEECCMVWSLDRCQHWWRLFFQSMSFGNFTTVSEMWNMRSFVYGLPPQGQNQKAKQLFWWWFLESGSSTKILVNLADELVVLLMLSVPMCVVSMKWSPFVVAIGGLGWDLCPLFSSWACPLSDPYPPCIS